MTAQLAPSGLGAAQTPPASGQMAPAAQDALAQLATIQATLTAAGAGTATPQMIQQALTAASACAQDVQVLNASQIPPGMWVSGGVAVGGAVGAGLLGGLVGWMWKGAKK